MSTRHLPLATPASHVRFWWVQWSWGTRGIGAKRWPQGPTMQHQRQGFVAEEDAHPCPPHCLVISNNSCSLRTLKALPETNLSPEGLGGWGGGCPRRPRGGGVTGL